MSEPTISASTASDASKTNNNRPHALLSTAYSYAQTSLDAAIPPSTRQRAYNRLSAFASNQPILFVRPLPPTPPSHPFIIFSFKREAVH
jgi:hypothetical protein